MKLRLYGAAIVVLLVLVATAFLSGEPTFAIPVVLVALIVFAFFAFNDLLAKRSLRRHDGDMQAVQADEDDPFPTAHVIADDATALGDTAEAHAEINPHDFPKDSPGRMEADRQAGGEGGTTRGDADPSEPGDDAEVHGATPGSKDEGYPGGRPSSPKAESAGSP